jgi:hypothetical protein
MKAKKLRLGVFTATISAVALAFAATEASAAVCSGACGSLGANGDVTAPPSSSSSYGWVSTFGGINGVGQLPTVGGTDGSTFTTSAFAAKAGDNLQYYFNYISSDGQNGVGQFVFEDYASVQLVDANTDAPVAMLFNARTEPTGNIVPGAGLPSISPGVTLDPAAVTISAGSGLNGGPVWAPLGSYSGQCWGPGCGLTGWVKSDYTVGSDGTYRLIFGVTNWGDTVFDSGLAFSGINIGGTPIEDSVPEPSSWAVMLIGLGTIGGFMRKHRNKAESVMA